MEIIKNNLTRIVVSKEVYDVLQLAYRGTSIRKACRICDVPNSNINYAIRQLKDYYKVYSLYALMNVLIREGFLVNG